MEPRKKKILKAIIEDYIQNAEPVGSKALAERHDMNLSSATLRNEMAVLEEQGYLVQPHTSAGRVPTPHGYRMYVDDLMQRHRMSVSEMSAINSALRLRIQEYDRLIEDAGKLLARMTRYAAITSPPIPERLKFQRFELFLADQSALVIVAVLEGGHIRNKLIRLTRPAEQQAIHRLSEALNICYTEKCAFTDADREQCRSMAGPGAEYLPIVNDFIEEIFRSVATRESFLSGEAGLLDHPEFRDVWKARQTLEYLTEQRQELMNIPSAADDRVRITIGPENLAAELHDTSVIMASFQMKDGQQGLIGLVGPTRMDYSKMASRLSYIAARLASLLQKDEEETPDAER